MKEEVFTVASAQDGLLLEGIEVLPSGKIKGLVQISHGMVEHKERYLDFMRFLAAHGYASVVHDHRGHGKSVKSQADWGYFYDDAGVDIVEDLNTVAAYARKDTGNVPIILFGHSMGSLVVRSYIKKYDNRIDKLIVCGAPGYNPAAGVGLGIVNVMSKFKGDMYRSPFISSLATGNFDKRFEGDRKNRWISANEDNVIRYNATPECSFTFTLNGFKNLFSLMKSTYSKKDWGMQQPLLPILFIAGRDDPVILGEKKWQEAQDFLKKQGYTRISGKLYDGMRHEILNEEDHMQVYQDILAFLNEDFE